MDLEKRAAVPQSHDKHGTSSTQTPGNVTNKIKYLPNNVVTSGSGGGKSVKIKEGSYKGYGAGKLDRKDIFGTTYHPSTSYSKNPKALPGAFVPIADRFGIDRLGPDLRGYYQILPQDSRPGGDLMEWKITPSQVNTSTFNHSTLSTDNTYIVYRSLYLVADLYSGNETQKAIDHCGGLNITISGPILFNSTGNIEPGSVVQYYRGDSAAITLQGYDNTKGLSDNKTLVPNPPFPDNTWKEAWDCINKTTGETIPLMEGGPPLSPGGIVGIVVSLVFVFVVLPSICFYRHKKRNNARSVHHTYRQLG